MRNWMMAEAYDAAETDDFSVVRQLQLVLSAPYDEQGGEYERYAQPTPQWARERPGLAYMS